MTRLMRWSSAELGISPTNSEATLERVEEQGRDRPEWWVAASFPGPRRDDVAALQGHGAGDEFVDDDAVTDRKGVLHRPRGMSRTPGRARCLTTSDSAIARTATMAISRTAR